MLMLFELIGLKIIFDVALRDVGTTPSWDMDILYSHLTAEIGTLSRDFSFGGFYLLKPYLPSQLNTQDALAQFFSRWYENLGMTLERD